MINDMQNKVQKVLDEAVTNGTELGVQAAVYYKGELVVNAFAGYTDSSKSKKVDERTVFPVYSTGKGIASTVIHRLVEKGILSYDTRVADLWPEYACNGKENTLLWHFLSHRAGMQSMPENTSLDDQTDWNKMCSRLAEMTPAWEPGTNAKYHSWTYGWLIGEVARRATGKIFPQLLNEEISGPLGIDSIFYGITPEAETRTVTLEYAPYDEQRPESMHCMNMSNIRRSCNPAAACMTNALSIARHYASLVDGVDGVRLLKPETVENATKLCRADYDPIPLQIGTWELFGLGYVLSGPKDNLGRIFGHGGAGGSEGLFDKEKHLAVGFTRNYFTGKNVLPKFYETIGFKHRDW